MKQYAIILLVDNTLPGGGVRTLTTWPGGKIRSITGNATTPLYFTYGVNAQSNLWVCGTSGSENSGADTVSYFDPAGRTKYIEYADELFDTYGYDILGRMTNLLDRAGQTARYGWDVLSNPLSVENEIGDDFAKVSYGFDKPSLSESITNQLNQQIMFSTRDIPGRKITERDIEGQDKITRFLAGDRVSSVIRRDGVVVSNVWNAAGNLVEVRYDDDPQLYISWRADELPLQMSNTTSNVSWIYNEYGRPFIETQETLSGTFSATVSNTLNSAALPSRVTVCDASGFEIMACVYGYDSAERISTVTPQLPTPSSSPSPVSYIYDAVHGLPSEVDGDVLDAEHSYNLLGQVTNITYRKNAGGTVVSSFDYLYSAAGMITNKESIVDGTQSTISYTYDELNRLTSETLTPITPSGSPSSTLYTYDLAGNRLTAGASAFTYANNKLSSVLHDAAGNITNMVRGSVTLDLSWNVQGQLTAVNTNGVFAESYRYDPLGRRVSTTDAFGTVYHVYDGDQCVADTDGSGNVLLSYTWGVGIDNLLAVTVHAAGETNSYYAVKDHLRSVHALVDESGSVVRTFSFDAWGIPQNSTFTIPNSQFRLRYLFQGREYSHAAGLYNFRARWYSPNIGRWLSPDPIGLEGGLNLYEFCGNNPVNFIDPMGLSWGTEAIAVGGGVLQIAAGIAVIGGTSGIGTIAGGVLIVSGYASAFGAAINLVDMLYGDPATLNTSGAAGLITSVFTCDPNKNAVAASADLGANLLAGGIGNKALTKAMEAAVAKNLMAQHLHDFNNVNTLRNPMSAAQLASQLNKVSTSANVMTILGVGATSIESINRVNDYNYK